MDLSKLYKGKISVSIICIATLLGYVTYWIGLVIQTNDFSFLNIGGLVILLLLVGSILISSLYRYKLLGLGCATLLAGWTLVGQFINSGFDFNRLGALEGISRVSYILDNISGFIIGAILVAIIIGNYAKLSIIQMKNVEQYGALLVALLTLVVFALNLTGTLLNSGVVVWFQPFESVYQLFLPLAIVCGTSIDY